MTWTSGTTRATSTCAALPTEASFELNRPLSAGVLKPVGELPQADEELLCLIMPLRLPDATG
jgi:hypothetical protein